MTHEPFPGRIATTAAASTPWWPGPPERLAAAPNIVLVVLDDTGWADLGCYGSEIATPTIDRLAERGVRFNNFHVTPLCSPTRASLLTGRNHHRVGMRFLADADTGFPNSRGHVRDDVPMLAEALGGAGYGTYLCGKWHLTPLHEITPAGPTHNWPVARGYDRFYGFLDGCTDQYSPELFQDNHQVEPPQRDGYHLTEDLVDHANRYVRDHVAFRPGAPFFLHLALGATHAPFQAPRELVEKYVGVFADGWDRARERRLARQVELGVTPPSTELTERNPGVPAWTELDPAERELFTHLQAAFAAYLEHADTQLGRLVTELERLGVADNTAVVVLSDNGASREGGRTGDVDTNAPYSGIARPAREQLAYLDDVGTADGPAFYPEGWAMAGNTPFRRYKQYVDLGGVRSPLVVSWPGHVDAPGRVDATFGHAVDLTPTLLDFAGLRPLDDADGTSLAAVVQDADAPAGRREQLFEMLGHRAIWRDGWFATTEHVPGTDYAADHWRLYDTTTDFAQVRDLADEQPGRLTRLQDRWWQLARAGDVLPLDDRPLVELLHARNPEGLIGRETLVLRPGQGHVPFASAVTGSNRDVQVTARLTGYRAGVDGALLASGNRRSGYSLYVLGGRLSFEHHFLGHRTRVESPDVLPDGVCTVGFALAHRDAGGADVDLLVDGEPIGHAVVPHTSGHLSFYGLDVGHDPVSPVSCRYRSPFPFPPQMLCTVTLRFTGRTDLAGVAELRQTTQ